MFGTSKNTDGTQTWGNSETKLPANAAIQVTFSMPMVRDSLDGIDIKSGDIRYPDPVGKWTLSADWLTATFYLDAGVQLNPGTAYTVTVNGADSNGTKVANVYGNSIEDSAVGTFTAAAADSLSPTVQWNSPTVIQMGGLVDVTQTFRVEANELLDVNGITIEGTPSIGAKPGVIYLGKNATGLYVYEFVLGEPLMLDQSYNLRVYGGKDLAGHQMNILTGSIRTYDAANTQGISTVDGNGNPVSAEFQNLQAQVKTVFGKWVTAMNDRNISKIQSVMAGDFYMEYDASHGIDTTSDINRDGRYSLSEFSNMFAKNAFVMWDSCGTTLTGDVIGSINVDALTETGDFEFTLTASNQVNSRSCSEAAPREHLYATLKFKNGVWKIVRASTGIDTRQKDISVSNAITTTLTQYTWPYDNTTDDVKDIADGGQMSTVPNTLGDSTDHRMYAKYSWDAVPGVSSYVVVIVDARNPGQGWAVAFPTTVTGAETREDWFAAGLKGFDVSQKFGFSSGPGGTGNPAAPKLTAGPGGMIYYLEGGRYYWEVIGFGTIAAADIGGKGVNELLKDITATSAVKSFSAGGVFKELDIQVRPGINTSGTALTYSEIQGGYDVGSAYRATLTIGTPNADSLGGSVNLRGSSQASYPITFDPSTGYAVQTVVLYKGWNMVQVCDQGNWSASPPQPYLCKQFGILTSGGVPPVIGIWDVTDDMGNVVTGDIWNYYATTPGSTKVTIDGGVTNSSVTSLSLNLWNQSGARYSTTIPVTTDSANNYVYSVDLDIYKGENWISLSGNGMDALGRGAWYQSNFGVYTDTGTVWVPPISVAGVATAILTADYGMSQDWDASTDSDDIVSIQGKFKTIQNGSYQAWSDGANSNGQVIVGGDGSFEINNIALYNGWNYISIADSSYQNYFNVNIFTSKGKAVIRTKINSINQTIYDQSGQFGITGSCYAVLAGTAVTGPVYISWNGSTGMNSYYESQTTQADQNNAFTATVAIVGGTSSYNYINVMNKDYKATNVTVTTTGQCAYVPLALTLSSVTDPSDGVLTSDSYGYYQAGSNTNIKIKGTDTRPGWGVSANSYVCGLSKQYSATTAMNPNAFGTYDWTMTVPVYDGYTSFSLQDGYTGNNVSVYALNGNLPPAPMNLTSVSNATKVNTFAGTCGSSQWDATGGTTGVTKVDVTGTTTAPDGTGMIYLPTGGYVKFSISGGNFTVPGIDVYNGSNSFAIYDSQNNYVSLEVLTLNARNRPHFITITSPLMNQTIDASTGPKAVTVTGSVADPTGSGYAPNYLNGYIYDGSNYSYQFFSTDLYEQQNYGYGALLVSAGTFSFSGSINQSNSWTEIRVYGYDQQLGISHAHDIYVNTGSSWSDYYYKPGTSGKAGKNDAKALRDLMFLKQMEMRAATID